jgi:hypothetical protein
MGCDIHVHIEVQKDGVWHHFAAPKIRRDYFLFAVIAGERADLLRNSDKITPVAKVHRLPGDISLVTRVSVEQDKRLGIHNFGVLSAADLIELQNQLYALNPHIGRTGCDELDLEWSIFRTFINGNTLAQHQGWDDLRVVFWFDG